MRKPTLRVNSPTFWLPVVSIVVSLMFLTAAQAQETDITQTPNNEQAGIKKSLAQQIGAGRGDINTPDSSLYIISRDPFRSIRRGRNLFQRKFTVEQGFGPRTGDGHGDIAAEGSIGAGLVDSCAGCHGRPRGAAGFGGDVFTRPDSRDAPHLFGLGIIEMLADEITQDLRQIRDRATARANASNRSVVVPLSSKGISYGRIRVNPDGSVDPSHLEGVNEDLRVRPFFAQGGTISIREFVVGALNAEMGLEAFDPDLADAVDGKRVVTPSGMVLDGNLDKIEAPPASSESDDPDSDGVANEIPVSLVDHMEYYLLNYFKPGIGRETRDSRRGKEIFKAIRCTGCHIPSLVIDRDRRVADVETTYDRRRGIFNSLFAVATPLFQEDPASGSPSVKKPNRQRFVVRNIYADFKRHDLGPNFWERNFDGTLTKEFMTEPLWGVGSSAPFGHDGRSIDLWSVIMRHGGKAQDERNRFARLSDEGQAQVIAFLLTLVLFPPDDTASNLNPGDPQAPNFPQYGHGNIKLPALFNDPTDLE
ncbi:MAG: di-heme oxidoredictase family protein [Nitrospirales bacterium]